MDDEEPVRLAVIGGKFGEEFIVGDACRSREFGFGANPCPDFFRDLCRGGDAFDVFGHVEIGLVKRQGLDDRRVSGEDFPDLQGDRLVSVEARLDEDQIGAFPLGCDRRHRGMHAEPACFVTCRRDHTAFARSADRNRLAPQLRIVTLFDRCVKRIHIDMDDFTAAARPGR